jgi:hypothetical protein
MDPRLFLTLAGSLANNPAAGPAECRTAISRSYYAAYLVAVSFLETLGLRPRSGPQGHAAVRNGMLASQDPMITKIGSDLDTLHTERNHADYDLTDSGPEQPKTAQALWQQAGKIIVELDACRRAPARNASVAAAIKKWATATPGSGLVVI